MAGPLLSFDADQQVSAVRKNIPQQDRWHVEEIAPRRGPAFHLVVIADGEGSEAAGEIAELAVQIAFAEAQLRRDEPLPKLFKYLARQMNQVVFRQGGGTLVGFTMAAIRAGVLSVVQAGSQTRCYRVRGERTALLLTRDNDSPLGQSASLPALPLAQYKLKRGDKLVFCSDGLFSGDLVTPADLAKIDRYREVKGAARHLSALAMGRNVDDNVTVIVFNYGRKRGLSIKNLAFDVLGVLLAVSIIAGLVVLVNISRLKPRPPDLGIAVLAEGSAAQAEQLHSILPGKDLNASSNSPILLSLKRLEVSQSGPTLTDSIPGVSLIFGEGAFLNLAAIDVQGFTDPQMGIKEPTNLTEIRLYEGRALILSRDERTFYAWLGSTVALEPPLVVLQGTEAALGIELQQDAVQAYCLRGMCSLHFGKNSISFDPSTKISFALAQNSLEDILPEAMEDLDRSSWITLCSTWQEDKEAISSTCQLLFP